MRHATLASLLATGLLIASCSESSPSRDGSVAKTDGGSAGGKVADYVPGPTALAGWSEDTSAGKAGVEAGYSDKDIEAIINGHNAPYAAEGTVGFAKEDYKKDTFQLGLKIWQMKTAAGAQKMYDTNKKEGETKSGLTFEMLAGVADKAALAQDAPQWKVYGYKGPYTYSIYATYADATKAAALKTEVTSFVTLLVSKLP